MAWKYDRPEWKKTPVAAQVREALREVEQVKMVLLSLQHKATQFDEYFQQRAGYLKQRVGKGLKKQQADLLEKAEKTMGNWSLEAARADLVRLDGWMKSLTESEMGLHSLLSPGYSGPATDFVVKRSIFVKEEGRRWMDRIFWLLNR